MDALGFDFRTAAPLVSGTLLRTAGGTTTGRFPLRPAKVDETFEIPVPLVRGPTLLECFAGFSARGTSLDFAADFAPLVDDTFFLV